MPKTEEKDPFEMYDEEHLRTKTALLRAIIKATDGGDAEKAKSFAGVLRMLDGDDADE